MIHGVLRLGATELDRHAVESPEPATHEQRLHALLAVWQSEGRPEVFPLLLGMLQERVRTDAVVTREDLTQIVETALQMEIRYKREGRY